MRTVLKRPASLPLPFLLLLVAGLLAGMPVHAAGVTIYCCESAQGTRVCGDTLPRECFGRAYREMSPHGTVRRHVAAPVGEKERRRQAAEAERRGREEAESLRQQRRDTALLETYVDIEDIDDREARALARIDRGMHSVRERKKVLIDEQAALLQERARVEPPDAVSPRLQQRILQTERELETYRGVLADQEAVKRATRERYEQERRRYRELNGSGGER